MTYSQFHLIFTLPLLALLIFVSRRTWLGRENQLFMGLGFLCLIAFVYTTPWDNYLVYRGVWGYEPHRVLAVIGYVPIEEYAFFILQTLITGFFLWNLRVRFNWKGSPRLPLSPFWVKALGVGFYLALALWGLWVWGDQPWTYMSLILVWAYPVLAFQWAYGGDQLLKDWPYFLVGVAVPTLYFGVADAIAIYLGVWEISALYTTGWMIGNLPFEEGFFFLTTNLLVVQGLWLFWWVWDQGKIPGQNRLVLWGSAPQQEMEMNR